MSTSEYHARWYLENKERIHEKYIAHAEERRAYSREYRKEHPEKIRLYNQKYRNENRDQVLEQERKYASQHKDLRAAIQQNRRSKYKGTFTNDEWMSLCRSFDYRCAKCKRRRKLTRDHVIPLSLGGANTIDNIQPLCRHCNATKHTRIEDYRS